MKWTLYSKDSTTPTESVGAGKPATPATPMFIQPATCSVKQPIQGLQRNTFYQKHPVAGSPSQTSPAIPVNACLARTTLGVTACAKSTMKGCYAMIHLSIDAAYYILAVSQKALLVEELYGYYVDTD